MSLMDGSVVLAVAAVLFAAARSVFYRRAKGKGCSSCPHQGACYGKNCCKDDENQP